MTTTYTVVLNDGTVEIDAATYRTPTPTDDEGDLVSASRELYFYDEPEGEGKSGHPVATFPIGAWEAVFETDRGGYYQPP